MLGYAPKWNFYARPVPDTRAAESRPGVPPIEVYARERIPRFPLRPPFNAIEFPRGTGIAPGVLPTNW